MAITFSELWKDFDGSYLRVWYYDSTAGTFTEITDYANFDYFADTAVAGDALYFGFNNSTLLPTKLKFYIGTALAATGIDIKWEYCNKPYWSQDAYYFALDTSADFAEFPDYTDGTNAFQNTGEQIVEINSVPNDLSMGSISAIDSTRRIWYRARIDSVSGLTEGGRQSTQNLQRATRRLDVYGGYDSGTITSVSGGTTGHRNIITDYSKSWSDYELTERYILFTSGACEGEMYPIKKNVGSVIYLGEPRNWSGEPLYTQNEPVAGDSYIISYVARDLYDASVTAGNGWVEAFDEWGHRHFLYNAYKFNCYLQIYGTSSTKAFLSTLSEYWLFGPTFGMRCYNAYYPYSYFATGWSLQSNRNSNLYESDREIATGGTTFNFSSVGYFNPIFQELRGWIKDARFIGGVSGSWTKSVAWKGGNTQVYRVVAERLQMNMNSGRYDTHLPAPDLNRIMLAKKSEPLRNPDPEATISNYMTEESIVYATTSHTMAISDSYCNKRKTFTSWLFTGTCDMIDMHPDTNWDKDAYAFYWYTNSGTTYGGILYRKYHIDVKLLDEFNNPISNARVKLINGNGDEMFNVTPDSNGEIAQQLVLTHEYTWDNTGSPTDYYNTKETDYNPFTLEIRAAGYRVYKMKFNFTKKEVLTFRADKNKVLNLSNSVKIYD